MKSDHLSFSQITSFMECEAAKMAELRGEYSYPKTEAYLVGNYLHAWNEGKLDEFIEENKSLIFTKKGKKKKAFADADHVIEEIPKDHYVMSLLSGQKEVKFKEKLFGIPFEIRIDSYNPDMGFLSDLKYVKKINDKIWNNEKRCYENFVVSRKYDIQAALYLEVERIAKDRDGYLMPYVVALSKETPFDRAVIYFAQNNKIEEFVKLTLSNLKPSVDRILEVKYGGVEPKRCGKCAYCRMTKKAKAIYYKDIEF